MKSKKILVCVHIYYHNQANYIIDKLKNLDGFDYDLYVTYSQEDNETNQKFLNFNENTKFLLTKNIGYDVYPFLVLIDKIDLGKYYCLLKLHTKNCNKFGSYSWRDDLYENLIGTKRIFSRNLSKLKKYGMVGSEEWILQMGGKVPEDTWLYDEICKKIGIQSAIANFVAGTIFLSKIEIIQKIKELGLLKLDFNNKKMQTSSNGTPAHVTERLFGVVCEQLGYKIYGSSQRKIFSKEWKKKFIRNIFELKNKYTYKNLTFLWHTIKINRYEYLIQGERNNIYVFDEKKVYHLRKRKINGLDIEIKGDNNLIILNNDIEFQNSKINIEANRCIIEIKTTHDIKNLNIKLYEQDCQELTINKNSEITDLDIKSCTKHAIVEVSDGEISNSTKKVEKQKNNYRPTVIISSV